jgi:hypothetical protein
MASEAVEGVAGEERAALLSGKGPFSWDHDQLPAGLADSERIVSVLFEDAQDIGHRRAGFGLGQAPADDNPLTDIGGR